ncbi:hypothetical protein O3P69_002382 [Scylla paramamosain]|uniref:Uncharacterized protein n=1 Tax=Scylla paramamosain TaxID=85552 RepID=A0AAW0V650_SCYPA
MPVRLDLSKAQKKEDTHVQYLPCKIDFCGNAEIDKHFSASVSEGQEGAGMDGRLRGHPLNGEKMSVPKGYTGVVLREAQMSVAAEGGQVMKGLALFDNFTYWNWDRQPSRSDKYQQALDWLEVASVIHGTDD